MQWSCKSLKTGGSVCESNTPATSKMPPAGFEDRELHPQPYASSISYQRYVRFGPFQAYYGLGEYPWRRTKPTASVQVHRYQKCERSTSAEGSGAKAAYDSKMGHGISNTKAQKATGNPANWRTRITFTSA